MNEIDKIVAATKATKRGFVATIISTEGSTYRKAGARAVIGGDAVVAGVISGGCLERDLIARSDEWMRDMQPRVVTYDSSLDTDIVFGLGLGCRGVMTIHVEPFDELHRPRLEREFAWNGREPVIWQTGPLTETIQPPRAVAIYGGGPDVAPVVLLAETLGWDARVVAPRDVHPEQVTAPNDVDAVVIMTHNFLYDLALLRTMFTSDIPYIGLLGPRERGEELLAEIPNADRSRLHSPIGLDIGGETPEEIALSIVAEIQAGFVHRSSVVVIRSK